ncbi:hypothetical protein CDEST_08976 [Colletotrichum destructivum]|uniref:Uncharacterized protein n=1 Tax=Colletotrichum destructivum TaxID=34406 RepID=A0AAX4IL98_9PEZI|nr:hypothetical protein CDEST_08976 [Colletotrichum destructivum]
MIRKRTSMKGKPLLLLAAIAGIATAQVKPNSFTVSGRIYIGCAVLNNVATETFDFPANELTPQLCHSMPFSSSRFSFLRRRGRAPAVLIALAARVASAAWVALAAVAAPVSRPPQQALVYLSNVFQRFSDEQRYFDIGVSEQQYRGRTALFNSDITTPFTAADLVDITILITVKVIAAPSTGPATTLDA